MSAVDMVIGNVKGQIFEVMQANDGTWYAWFAVASSHLPEIKQVQAKFKGDK